MTDIHFKCAACGRHLEVDQRGAGRSVSCPDCSASLTIPTASTKHTCPKCNSTVLVDNNLRGESFRCSSCQYIIHIDKNLPVPQKQKSEQNTTLIFKCSHCGSILEVDATTKGQPLDCPNCHSNVTVPSLPKTKHCSHCQATTLVAINAGDENFECSNCHQLFYKQSTRDVFVPDMASKGNKGFNIREKSPSKADIAKFQRARQRHEDLKSYGGSPDVNGIVVIGIVFSVIGIIMCLIGVLSVNGWPFPFGLILIILGIILLACHSRKGMPVQRTEPMGCGQWLICILGVFVFMMFRVPELRNWVFSAFTSDKQQVEATPYSVGHDLITDSETNRQRDIANRLAKKQLQDEDSQNYVGADQNKQEEQEVLDIVVVQFVNNVAELLKVAARSQQAMKSFSDMVDLQIKMIENYGGRSSQDSAFKTAEKLSAEQQKCYAYYEKAVLKLVYLESQNTKAFQYAIYIIYANNPDPIVKRYIRENYYEYCKQ